MGEKGNFIDVDGGDTAFVAGAAGTVVTVASDLGTNIKDKVVDAAANQVIAEGRERVRGKKDADDPATPEAEGLR